MFWQELGLVPVLVLAAWWLAARAGRAWGLCFAAALLVVSGVIVARRFPGSTALGLFRLLADARINPLVMAVVIPLMLGVLIRRLARGRQRGAVSLMMAALVFHYCVLPGAMPLYARAFLLDAKTVIDERGVCHQTHDFTCGPASMVTCLRVLGVQAEEGEVAALSRCGPAVGTDPAVLAEAVGERFGVAARYRTLSRLAELRPPAVVELQSEWGWGHYVAVMEKGEDRVLVGDPDAVAGSACMWVKAGELETEWTGRVVEVQRP